MNRIPALADDSPLPEIARRIAEAGGRAIVVGGWVRDQLRGDPSKDLDVEVFGLDAVALGRLLAAFGAIGPVGRQFPVWRFTRSDIDVALPRTPIGERSGETAPEAARGAESVGLAFAAAARHRDLTCNAIGWDPLDGRLLDPFDGRADLEAGCLRAVDAETFGADPLRVLRVARFRAMLEAEVEPATAALCRGLDPGATPVERQAGELGRLLLEPRRPSLGLESLRVWGQLRVWPELAALVDVPQDPRWHPEGDVFRHTGWVVDRARVLGQELEFFDREVLQWAALTHDFGKPEATIVEEDGRVRSPDHERPGAARAEAFLSSLRIAGRVVAAVRVLVAHHLAPVQFVSGEAKPRAYRRLARRLADGGCTLEDLERLARADQLGRDTEEARAGRFEAGARFLERAEAAGVRRGVPPDAVTARMLMQRGLAPGPALGEALDRARHLQDGIGDGDPERILAALAGEGRIPRSAPER